MNLVKWDEIRAQIEVAKDIDELTNLKDRLQAYQILAKQSKQSQEVQSKIAIYKARADRKCGEWLKENIPKHNEKNESQPVTRLKDLGVAKNESARLQKIAEIPEEKFEEILTEAEETTKKITNNMLVNIARESAKHEKVVKEANKETEEVVNDKRTEEEIVESALKRVKEDAGEDYEFLEYYKHKCTKCGNIDEIDICKAQIT